MLKMLVYEKDTTVVHLFVPHLRTPKWKHWQNWRKRDSSTEILPDLSILLSVAGHSHRCLVRNQVVWRPLDLRNVLVTFLFLWQAAITKATYKREHLIGFMVSEFMMTDHRHGGKSSLDPSDIRLSGPVLIQASTDAHSVFHPITSEVIFLKTCGKFSRIDPSIRSRSQSVSVTEHLGTCNKQKCLPHSLGGLETQDQGFHASKNFVSACKVIFQTLHFQREERCSSHDGPEGWMWAKPLTKPSLLQQLSVLEGRAVPSTPLLW